jgi:hypothetical protein
MWLIMQADQMTREIRLNAGIKNQLVKIGFNLE